MGKNKSVLRNLRVTTQKPYLLSHQKNVWQNDKCYPETYSETYAQLVMIQCIAWTVGVAFPQQTLKFHREVQILMIFKS